MKWDLTEDIHGKKQFDVGGFKFNIDDNSALMGIGMFAIVDKLEEITFQLEEIVSALNELP